MEELWISDGFCGGNSHHPYWLSRRRGGLDSRFNDLRGTRPGSHLHGRSRAAIRRTGLHIILCITCRPRSPREGALDW